MAALTTRQRDLLQLLLDAKAPLGTADLAAEMQLTPRQVNYGLKGLKRWLAQREIMLKMTPGVGIEIDCLPEQASSLSNELASVASFELVLSAEQRQQLLAFVLLAADEPFILYQLQQLTQVSRTTILKDLDALEGWIETHDLKLERRPNYGFSLAGAEGARREALAALAWGAAPFGQPLTSMTHGQGLQFSLTQDAELLPLLKQVNAILCQWDMQRTFGQVAYAEAQLGGRFTDDAVLYLALIFAIQLWSVKRKNTLNIPCETIADLRTLPTWQVAEQVSQHLAWNTSAHWPESEIASLAMHILAAPRNERWPGDLETDVKFGKLVDTLLEHIAEAYQMPSLIDDKTLHDGIVTQIVPACFRQRFGLWMPPPLPATTLSDKYSAEHLLAHQLSSEIEAQTGVVLPESEINNVALLLRAAYIRIQPSREHQVIVVCPSGMATAQLLVARLKARFPRIESFEVLSVRDLSQNKLAAADLLITTTTLPEAISSIVKVIRVHPLLLAEDIEAITQWLE